MTVYKYCSGRVRFVVPAIANEETKILCDAGLEDFEYLIPKTWDMPTDGRKFFDWMDLVAAIEQNNRGVRSSYVERVVKAMREVAELNKKVN